MDTDSAGRAGAPPVDILPDEDVGVVALRTTWSFLQEWGFLVLAAVAVVVWMSPYLTQKLRRAQKAASLAKAQAPARVEVLEAERRKVRERQMAQYEEASRKYREEHPEVEKRRREEARKAKLKKKKDDPDKRLHYFDIGFGSSPLNGGGGVGGFRPQRFQGRGGGGG